MSETQAGKGPDDREEAVFARLFATDKTYDCAQNVLGFCKAVVRARNPEMIATLVGQSLVCRVTVDGEGCPLTACIGEDGKVHSQGSNTDTDCLMWRKIIRDEA